MEIALLLGCFYLARRVEMISTPVASELILLTVRTRQCRVLGIMPMQPETI